MRILWICWHMRPFEDMVKQKGTYSQNSMTGEVAFSWWLMELFPLWNAIQESWMKERQKDIQASEEIQACSKVSKLHTGKWNNATTETEWNGAGTLTLYTDIYIYIYIHIGEHKKRPSHYRLWLLPMHYLCSSSCCRRPRAGPMWRSWTERRWPRLTQRCNRRWAEQQSPGWHNPLLEKKTSGWCHLLSKTKTAIIIAY